MRDIDGNIKRIEANILEKIFYHTASRRVNNDATIITVKYIPDLSHVFIYEDDEYIEIKEVDKRANASIKRNSPILKYIMV